MSDETLSLKKVQDALGVSYQSLMTWLSNGYMTGKKVSDGRREVWRIPTSEVERIRDERIASLEEEIAKLKNIQIRGVVFSPRPRDQWPGRSAKAWATAVANRDRWTCQDCGVTAEQVGTQKIHAHHIVPVSAGGKHVLQNGITLCSMCHAKVHSVSRRED